MIYFCIIIVRLHLYNIRRLLSRFFYAYIRNSFFILTFFPLPINSIELELRFYEQSKGDTKRHERIGKTYDHYRIHSFLFYMRSNTMYYHDYQETQQRWVFLYLHSQIHIFESAPNGHPIHQIHNNPYYNGCIVLLTSLDLCIYNFH